MLAAGDTFRAAAIEQLKIWGERTGSPVVASKLGADAAGLAYDAFEKAKEAGSDVLIIDTAGRLQNKTELMAELEKIVRVLGKLDPEAPHTVLQTVDATTGQNALNQVEIFRNVAGVNGLVMTKLDGTARGGILVAIAAKHKLPVYFIGVGEQVDDLEPFSASDFAKAIAGVATIVETTQPLTRCASEDHEQPILERDPSDPRQKRASIRCSSWCWSSARCWSSSSPMRGRMAGREISRAGRVSAGRSSLPPACSWWRRRSHSPFPGC